MSNEVKEKFKGRGNAWLKIPIHFDEVASSINNLINNTHYDTTNYVNNVNKNGFYWVRFKQTKGENSLFEVRFNGSTIDHPDSVIEIDNKKVIELPLLGNTPRKLNLESDAPLKMANIKKPKAKNSKRGRKPKNKLKALTQDELVSQAFDIQFNPTFPKVNIPLPNESDVHRYIDFLKLEGVSLDA